MERNQEIALVKKVQQGSRLAEEELFTHFIEQISWIVKQKLGATNEDWEDVTGESIFAALVCLRDGKFDVEKGNLGSYIYGITRNKIFDYFKQKKKQKENILRIEEIAQPVISEEDELNVEKQETNDNVMARINKIPVKYRDVLKLTLNEELSVKQISQQLNIPSEEVSKRLWYGRQLLKKNFNLQDIFLIWWLFFLIYN